MALGAQGHKAAQDRLWQAIAARGVGMLGLTKSGLHAQPMIAFAERRRKRLWFIARSDTDLVRTTGAGGPCMFVLQDGDLLASVAGELSVVEDPRRMARCWNAAIAAWLPEGPGDPRLTLLRMDCVDAELWVSGLGLTKFAWEIAWTGARPTAADLDGRTQATFH
jgi:general stress protein 26